MGIFDSVYAPCPHCGKLVEFQSKASEDAYMRRFTVDDAPAEILADVMNNPEHCMSCGGWMALVDPKYPPGEKPKPDLHPAKVRTPDNPKKHFQGMQWWPENEPFTTNDLTD